MNCIFPGRFQPFHKGHLYAIGKIKDNCDMLILIVENAGESFTFENPFTAGERIEMILGSIEKDEKMLIIPMENIKNNAEWVRHLKVMLPRFELCYSNNPLVRILMEEEGIRVEGIDFYERQRYSGTEIRKRIALGQEWKELVPNFVYDYIKGKGLEKRIRSLYGDRR